MADQEREMSLFGLLSQSKQYVMELWAVRDARERALLAVAAMAVVLGLFYALLIDPALTGRDKLNKDLPVLRQQVAQLQVLAKEAGEFSGKAAPPVTEISGESIKTALARKGLLPQSVTLTGDLVKVQLTAASFAVMLEWLVEMQKTERLSVVDANIAALAQPGMVNAALMLRQQRNE